MQRLRRAFSLIRSLLALAAPAIGQGLISTVAGTDWLFASNGKPARSAPLAQVAGVTLDGAGNLLVVDPDNAQIFRIDPSGVLTLLAGNGIAGYSGDNGPATAASLHGPSSVAVDAAGNVYIADSANSRIRKVTPAGTISTVAGTGRYDYSGEGGPAVEAALEAPAAVAVDRDGNLYIADTGAGRIRKVGADGKIVTIAGTGSSGLLYGDGGPALAASLNQPTDPAFDAAGNLFIADSGNRLVRRIDTTGKITTVAGSGSYLPP
jgi:sugar lactone lactonase YvrE